MNKGPTPSISFLRLSFFEENETAVTVNGSGRDKVLTSPG